ncbi:MAG: hypothetical protein PHX09_01520 [Clostridia bacterium]|nr:hypothetical protein [Clostridia bacterium]
MRKILPSVFLIISSIIGAGFASGRELSLFFAIFGYTSLYFLPIVFILFYYCFKMFLTIGSKNSYKNILDINKKIDCSIFFNITIIAIFIIYASAMFSGAVEVLSSNLIEVPTFIFHIFIFIISFLVLKSGLKGLYKINVILIPLVIILLIIYSVYSTINPVTDVAYIPSSTHAYILPISIIIYVMANILLSYFILIQAGRSLNQKEIKKVSFFATLIICFVLLICIICLITNGAVAMDASMPFVLLTLRLGEPFPFLFMFVLLLGIITSLFVALYTICSVFKSKEKNRTAFLCCSAVLLISLFGFEKIVNYCYPIIGLFGLILIFKFIYFENNLGVKSTVFGKKDFKNSLINNAKDNPKV